MDKAEHKEKWYEKTWEWIKKYWGIVLSAVTLAIGYIIGRKQSVSGADGLVAELRAEIGRLGEEVGQLRADNARLARLNEHDQAELRRIEEELGRARILVDEAGREIAGGRDDSGALAEDLGRLNEILRKHRKELEAIQSHD
jgi:chromosome segregation ATPase